MTRKQIGDGTESSVPAEVSGFLNMIRAAAENPDVDVSKLRELLEMQEHVLEKRAKIAWTEAMTNAQEEMRSVKGNKTNPQTRSRYATYQALDKVLRPIYTKNGFSLNFNTGQGEVTSEISPGCIRILLDVSHVGGHTRQFKVDMPVDGKGAKGGDVMTSTHATGSGMTYGMRYLLKFAFNVAVGEDDDDGAKAGGYTPEPRTQSAGPQSKSERKVEPEQEISKVDTTSRPDGYETIKKATDPKNRVSESNVKSISTAMKRAKIPENQFKSVFGFQLQELDKHGLSETVDWVQAQGR